MSAKNNSAASFYRVRAIIRIPGPQAIALEGMYLPRPDNETPNPNKLKKECLDILERRINWDKLPVPRDSCNIEVTYKVLHNDFLVVEGRE